jgi:hypothetical protein
MSKVEDGGPPRPTGYMLSNQYTLLSVFPYNNKSVTNLPIFYSLDWQKKPKPFAAVSAF